MIELFSEKINEYFRDACESTFAFIDNQFGHANAGLLGYLTKPKAVISVALDLVNKRISITHCFQALSEHVKTLFLNNTTRNGLFYQLIQIAGGNMSANELINTATDIDGKTPLKMRFNEYDVLTQFFLLLMIRKIVEQFIADLPVKLAYEDEGIVLDNDITHEFQVKANKLRQRYESRQIIFTKIREGLFKESILKQISTQTVAQLEQFISKLLRLLSLDGDFIIPREIKTPSFEGAPDPSEEEEEEEDIRTQLKRPYSVSDELRQDIIDALSVVGKKYLQAKKDPTNQTHAKVIQVYYVLKQINELITNSDSIIRAGETSDSNMRQIIIGIKHYLEPITVHAVFFVPEGDVIVGKPVQINKDLVFEKPFSLKDIYDKLQLEILEQMWTRVRSLPMHYDLIIKNMHLSDSTLSQIRKITAALQESTDIFFDLHKHPELIPVLAPAAKQRFAAEALNYQNQNQTISAAMLEHLRYQFGVKDWKAETSPYTLALIQVIEDLEAQIKTKLGKLGEKDFIGITPYKAEAPLIQRQQFPVKK